MTVKTIREHVATLLPHDVRERLVRAAKTPVHPSDPLARIRAIEEAALYARLSRPALFKQ